MWSRSPIGGHAIGGLVRLLGHRQRRGSARGGKSKYTVKGIASSNLAPSATLSVAIVETLSVPPTLETYYGV